MRGNTDARPNYQRTKAKHATDLTMWLSGATDVAFNSVTLDQLERRHGGKGGLSRREIECQYLAAQGARLRRAKS